MSAGDAVIGRLVTGDGTTLDFPAQPVQGLRPQPYADNAWLLDLAQLPAGWRQLDLVVKAPTSHQVSLALEVRRPEGGVEVLHHAGFATVPGAAMVALRMTPAADGWSVTPYDSRFADEDSGPPPPSSVPEALREPAVLALREHVVRPGDPVTAVVDLSASMRPHLTAGTVARVLSGVQALAGAAGQQGVSVVGVSDTVHGPRTLDLTADPEEFLRRWTHEIGFRTGHRNAGDEWIARTVTAGVVVSVTDQETAAVPRSAARSYRVVLRTPTQDRPAPERAGTVVIVERRPDVSTVVEALAHASPAA
ncbi:hypothetical protein [Geodermatophilus sp. URMC 64]